MKFIECWFQRSESLYSSPWIRRITWHTVDYSFIQSLYSCTCYTILNAAWSNYQHVESQCWLYLYITYLCWLACVLMTCSQNVRPTVFFKSVFCEVYNRKIKTSSTCSVCNIHSGCTTTHIHLGGDWRRSCMRVCGPMDTRAFVRSAAAGPPTVKRLFYISLCCDINDRSDSPIGDWQRISKERLFESYISDFACCL